MSIRSSDNDIENRMSNIEIHTRSGSEDEEIRGKALADLIMGDQDGSTADETVIIEHRRFLRLKTEFSDICQSRAIITWANADPRLSIRAPVIYFAVRMAMSPYHSTGPSMHSEGRLLSFLVQECGINLNAEYFYQFGYDSVIRIGNALSQVMESVVTTRENHDQAISVMHSLLTLGASPNVHFVFRSPSDVIEDHSLLYFAFSTSNMQIGELLFEFGAHFDISTDPSPMTNAMRFNNNSDIIYLFNKYKHLLAPQDIATDRSDFGTPLHSLAFNPPNDKQEGERLASILVSGLNVSPSMVDSMGKTPADYARQLRTNYTGMRNVDPMYPRRAQETVTLLQKYIDRDKARQNSVAAHQVLSHFLPDDERRIVQDVLRRKGGQFVSPKLVEESIARARAKVAARHSNPV